MNSAIDDEEDIQMFSNQELVEPCVQDGEELTRDQTTMFLNKYCEDTSLPSVANRLADTIVEYELNQGTPFKPRDDYEIDDEIISEEEHLIINEEPETVPTQDDQTLPYREVHDEICDEIDVVMNPTAEQSDIVANLEY